MDKEKELQTWRVVAIVSVCLLLIVIMYVGSMQSQEAQTPQFAQETQTADTGKPQAKDAAATQDAKPADTQGQAVSGEEALSLWAEGSAPRDALIAYIESITDESSADYIPPEDRIAVFDMDGTLCCETDPVYFDHMLLYHRVMEDPDHKDKATDEERAATEKVMEFAETGTYPEGLDNEHGRAIASAFSGFTVDEFINYVREYRETDSPGYEGLKRGDAFYKPMVQVVDYLKANDFTVYIVSGTDRLIIRGLVADGAIDIPPGQIIGSVETIVASGQDGEDGLEYQFKDGDQLLLGGDFVIKNLKMNKVALIMNEIGQQPVLSFGNSSGDASMAKYVTTENDHKSLAFMLCCDDTERENGKLSSAEKMQEMCAENHWLPISMKNDWTTIYGDGVTRKQQ